MLHKIFHLVLREVHVARSITTEALHLILH
jgi:hypothetical protein